MDGAVKLSDFAYSQFFVETKKSEKKKIGSLRSYVCPESYVNAKFRGSDVWSLGVFVF